SGYLLPPSPPAEKATACEEQAGNASTDDGAGNSGSALFAAALARPTDEPSDHEHGQQKRDDHAHADEHIDENDSGAALDGHDVRSRLASVPLYGQSSGSPRGFMH